METNPIEIDGVSARPSESEVERRTLRFATDENSRDAEPIEDCSEADSCALHDVALECGTTSGLVRDVLLSAADKGLIGSSMKRAEVSDETRKWRELSGKLFKVVQHLQPPASYASDEMEALAFLQTKYYVTLRAFDIPQFDFINGNLNTEEFAATVKVKKLNFVIDRKSGKGRTKLTDEERTKQAVNKALMETQKLFELPPRKDGRNAETRARQSAKRNGQLVKQ